jgi:hypothetical protein
MVYRGHVENGRIILPDSVCLPEGTQVRVEVVENEAAPEVEGPTLFERLKSVAGQAQGLPADASANVDHYLYGHPKK